MPQCLQKIQFMIDGRKPTFIRFTPDKTGEFLYLCDVFCGSGHENLEGSLFVT